MGHRQETGGSLVRCTVCGAEGKGRAPSHTQTHTEKELGTGKWELGSGMVAEEIVVSLSGGAPWGFRLQGGADQQKPLQVAKVHAEPVRVCGWVCVCGHIGSWLMWSEVLMGSFAFFSVTGALF